MTPGNGGSHTVRFQNEGDVILHDRFRAVVAVYTDLMRIANRRSPYCTSWPFSTSTFATSPSYAESISFINGIASMIHSTCPFLMR